MQDVVGAALAWCEQGRGVVLATVVSTWGSAPRPVGSLLAVNDAGEFVGSVSGGCVEAAVVEAALTVIAEGGQRQLHFGVTTEMAWEVGLACGGEIDILVEEAGGRRDVWKRLLEARQQKRALGLVTDLDSGEQWLCDPGAADPAAGLAPELRALVSEAIAADRAGVIEAQGRKLFANVFQPALRMLVVGAVHIAQPLVRLAQLAGFDVHVIDPRRAFATERRFPEVALHAAWPDEALRALEPDARTAVVTLTHDPKLDDPALAVALRSPAYYVGALGSRRTHAKRLERLRRQGFGDADLARVHGPVGLPIGSRTPQEIAVSIVAEAIAELRRPG